MDLPVAALVIVALTVALAELLFKPYAFADYAPYTAIADGLRAGYPNRWYEFEPLSSGLILALRLWTGDAGLAIDDAHYLLAVGFVLTTVFVVARYETSWQGVVIFSAAFGPLLAFVTIRATPAYFIVMLSALSACRSRWIEAIILVFLASLFHASALLAAPPLLLCILQNRFDALSWLNRRSSTIVGIAVIYGAIFSLFRSVILSVFYAAVNSVPIMAKYLVYLSSVDDSAPGGAGGEQPSAFHFVYWTATSLFVLAFMRVDHPRSNRLKGYVLISYLIFVFLLFSPVAGFRQSIFWMAPAIFVFPWRRITKGVVAKVAFTSGCLVLFAVGFEKVLA